MLSHIGLLLWLSYEAKTDSTQADKNKVTYGLLGNPKKPKITKLRFALQISTVFNCVPFSTVFSLYVLHLRKYSKNNL